MYACINVLLSSECTGGQRVSFVCCLLHSGRLPCKPPPPPPASPPPYWARTAWSNERAAAGLWGLWRPISIAVEAERGCDMEQN